MKLIDLYIARQVMSATLAVLLVIVGLDLMFSLVDQLPDIQKEYDLMAAMQYVAFTAPRRLYEHIPLSALIGCLLGLGTLATHSELTVMRAAGMSLKRIFWAVTKPVLVMVVFAAALGEWVVPHAEQKAQSFRSMKLSGGVALASRGVWHRDGSQFIHINAVVEGGEVWGVTRYRFDKQNRLQRASFAHIGRYVADEQYWLLEGVESTRFEGNRTVAERIPQEKWFIELTPELLSIVVVEPANLSMQGLWQYTDYLQRQGLQADNYLLAFWNKVFQPVAIMGLVLVAVSFIFGPLRSVTVGQRLIAGVVVGMSFKLAQDMLGPASTVFGFPPMVAVLLPIGLCVITGLYLIRRAG